MFPLLKKSNKKEAKSGNSLQNPRILEVNLVKDEVLVFFDWRRNLSVLFLVLAVAALFIAEIYFGLDWWEKQEAARSQTLQDSAVKTGAEANVLKKQINAALTYKEKSASFSQLLTDHIYWTNFFNWLEKNTLSSVTYGEFTGGLDGSYTLLATAKTYADVSWQVKAFLNDPFTQSVMVEQAQSNKTEREKTGEINFKIILKVKPEVFKK